MNRAEIRELSQKLDLSTWNKQPFACLSSRFVCGETISEEKLAIADRTEQMLDLGFHQVRVRIQGTLARIEILPEEFETIPADDVRKNIYLQVKPFGFTYVTLDLLGYRAGSMNETLR